MNKYISIMVPEIELAHIMYNLMVLNIAETRISGTEKLPLFESNCSESQFKPKYNPTPENACIDGVCR